MLNVVIFDPWQRSLFSRKRTPGKEPLLAGKYILCMFLLKIWRHFQPSMPMKVIRYKTKSRIVSADVKLVSWIVFSLLKSIKRYACVGPRSHKRFRRSQDTTALFSCPVSRPRARQVATYHVTDHDLLCGGGVTPTYSPSKMRCPPGHCNKLLQRNTS